jgi:hypothetical protein
MGISLFDGKDDSYWWVLCVEKFFKEQGTTSEMKLSTAVTALRGRVHQWWLWRSQRHPPTCWEMFTTVFLWRFKPEWRPILPIDNEEEEPSLELQQPKQGNNVHTQSLVVDEINGSTNPSLLVVVGRDCKFEIRDHRESVSPLIPNNANAHFATSLNQASLSKPKLLQSTDPSLSQPLSLSKPRAELISPPPAPPPKPLDLLIASFPPSKPLYIKPTLMSSPKPQGLMGFAGSENAKSFLTFDPGGNIFVSYSVSRRCLQIRNFQSFAMIFSPAVEVFDANHRSLSPATKSHDNTILLSLLCLPYDRGKMVFSSFLFPMENLAPAMVLLPVQGAASGWPWVPWSSMKMTASVTTTSVKHVREEDTHQG